MKKVIFVFLLRCLCIILCFALISGDLLPGTAVSYAATQKQANPSPAKQNQSKKATKTQTAKPTQKTVKKKTAQTKKNTSSKKNSPKKTNGKSASTKSASTKKVAKKPTTPYKGAVLYNAKSNKIVFSEKAKTQVPPASLTKILSMYVALDLAKTKKIPSEQLVTISPKAAGAGGSRMGLRAGEKVRFDALLMGMAVSSGNDASIAVAEFISGSEKRFVQEMNKKARAIGMKSSVFKNASGLPAKGQVTTANDMLLLAKSYLKAYPTNLQKYHNIQAYNHNGQVSGNANPLLGNYPGATGLKTGFVSAAGYNLIATATRGNTQLIGVILGAPTSSVRATEARKLMENGFTKYTSPAPSSQKVKHANTPKRTKQTPKQTTQPKKTTVGNAPQKKSATVATITAKKK